MLYSEILSMKKRAAERLYERRNLPTSVGERYQSHEVPVVKKVTDMDLLPLTGGM